MENKILTKEQEDILFLLGELLAYNDEDIPFIDIPYDCFQRVATAVIKLGYHK